MTQEVSIEKIIKFLNELQSQLDKRYISKKASDINNESDKISLSKNASDINNDEQIERQVEKTKPSSWWVRVREKINKICKEKKEASRKASDDEGSQGGSRRSSEKDSQDRVDGDLEIQKLQSDIRQMKAAFENLKKFQTTMSKSLEHDLPSDKVTAILEKTESIRSRFHDLKEIRRKILSLKCQIPSLLYKQSSSEGSSATDTQAAEENDQINENGSDIYLPGLRFSHDFLDSPAFEEVVDKFEGLDFLEKLCLLSFAVFPENSEVESTMLMYWWIGEGFIVDDDPEGLVTSILDDFETKGLLERVEDERKLKPSSYKMEPHVHSAVIYLAEFMDLFHLYSPEGKLAMQKKTKKDKVCLVKGSSLQKRAKPSVMEPKSLKTVFNSSERYPDFTFKWFLQMDSLKVLYLGRWERTAMRHIEVESTEFLKDMKALKNLTLASFQGISRIEKLHESICALRKLVILDLRACYNLEALPDDIGSLDNLIYLDVSECYMLDRMPDGIADLKRLQVLKGFVISETDDEKNCAVKHLVNLRKLSITVNKDVFKVEYLMESLKDLGKLASLKIAWGARPGKENKETTNEEKQKGHVEGREGDEVREKGQISEEKKEDIEETGKREVGQEDGDGRNEKKDEDLKSDKVTEGENKASPSREPSETIQDQKGKGKVEEEGDGDKEKGEQKQEKKPEVVEAESSKSEKKTSLPAESTETVQNKSDDQKGKSSVEEDGDKGKADLEEGKKQEEVESEKSKSDKVVEGEKKANTSQESSNTIERKLDDNSKVEEKGDEDKGKTDSVEGKKLGDEVEAEKSKSDNSVEGLKNAGVSKESTNMVQNKQGDHQTGEKQEEKGDGEKEEEKKKDEVKEESTKPDKVTPQESRDTIQSSPDDHKDNSNVQEKGDGVTDVADLKKSDGGEAKIQKLDKNKKLRKKVSFSEDIQKKPEQRDKGMAKEIHETASPSIPQKVTPNESGSSQRKLSKGKGNKSMRWGRKYEVPTIDTSKLPDSLKKLELECFPESNPPIWLNPENLNKLEKLSIKGGMLSKISNEVPPAENNCLVQILRLKYLHKFEAEWKELQALFPKMTLLEKYKCPKVAFCPTDGNGVWNS